MLHSPFMIMSKHAQQPCMELKDQRLKFQKSKGQRLAVRGATVNPRGAKGESNPFATCESHL